MVGTLSSLQSKEKALRKSGKCSFVWVVYSREKKLISIMKCPIVLYYNISAYLYNRLVSRFEESQLRIFTREAEFKGLHFLILKFIIWKNVMVQF